MLSRTAIVCMTVMLAAGAAAAERVELDKVPGDVLVTVEESNPSHTVINYKIGAFYREPVDIDGQTYYRLSLADEQVLMHPGDPAIPQICRSIIIPDDASMRAAVVSSDYVDLPDLPVAPSKGSILRTVNPDDVPFTFSAVYADNQWYPGGIVDTRPPFILRDYRGTVVEVNPIQYNPVTATVRVYTSITVEIVNTGPGEINVINDRKELRLVPEFDRLYRQRFINYAMITSVKYMPVAETGDMLVITYDSFHDSMMQFVNWKQQKGIKTTIVDISSVGNTVGQIKSFVQSFYDSTDLAWIVLVGDEGQIARPDSSGGAADPCYAKLAGSDNYPDAFIGRFSATTVGHAATQAQRVIDYEKNPIRTYWANKGTGIASNQGPGHYDEYDSTHMNYIRDDLLGFTYTQVDKFYDPYATASQVTAALNDGRSIINYCGHGSYTYWSTTGFSNTDVNNLSNADMLPFIISVACQNGHFDDGYTCFAEAWLRATDNGVPTGAIAAYMSSRNQYWDEPMEAQDEAVDLLVAESMTTFGGICFNGSCRMMDVYPSSGVTMFNTWIIFGDPSVQVMTDYPVSMTVNHNSYIEPDQTEFSVTVSGVEGALCALYDDGVLYGSAYTNIFGVATISVTGTLVEDETITLTVTAFNKDPYIAMIDVGYLPDAPTLVSPAHGHVFVGGRTVALDWLDVTGATHYEVLLDNNSDFSSPIANPNNLTASTYTTPYLGINTYYWKVRAENDIAWGPWSVVWSFEIRSGTGCPVLFTFDGDSYQKENPLLTACEKSGYADIVTDYYHITNQVAVEDGRMYFQLRESVDEITFLYGLELLTVDHSQDVNIACAVDGSIMTYSETIAPLSAVDNNGEDWLSAVVAEDGNLFMTTEPGYLEITFPNSFGDFAGFGFAALKKPPIIIIEDPPNPKVMAGQYTSTELTVEVLDDNGNWHEISSSIPSRENPVQELVFSDIVGSLTGEVITLRMSWNNGYMTDALSQFISTDEVPLIRSWGVDDYSLSLAKSSPEAWCGFEGGPLVLRKGDIFEFNFDLDEPENPDLQRDYVIRAVGRYQPDDPAYSLSLPNQFRLYDNYPNPFNPITRISYDLPAPTAVRIDVFNILGQTIRTLVDEPQNAGHYEVVWDSKDNRGEPVASGIYLYRITTNTFSASKKMLLLK